MKEYIVPFTNDADIDSFERKHGTNGEVIRCKDCKYLNHLYWLDEKNGKECYIECYICNKHTFTGMRNPDWFCADGERKKEQTNDRYDTLNEVIL